MAHQVVALTGASGFLGGYIHRRLVDAGRHVVSVPRSTLLDSDRFRDFISEHNVEDVVHLAALSQPSSDSRLEFYEVNALLPERLAGDCSAVGLPGRFLYVSATSVYGDAPGSNIDEDSACSPVNHYGASKFLGEMLCRWHSAKLDLVVARPSNCTGVGQKPIYVIPKFVRAYARKEQVIEVGDMEVSRDFIDVRDAADIVYRIIQARGNSLRAVNVSSGHATSLRDVAQTLTDLTGHSPEFRVNSRFIRGSDIKYQACSAQRAHSLGHAPRFSLRDTLKWMLESSNQSKEV